MRFDPVDRVTITVTGAGILAQFAIEDPPGLYASGYDFQMEERRHVQAVYNWSSRDFRGRKIVGVRVRNSVAGTPAQVTIDA